MPTDRVFAAAILLFPSAAFLAQPAQAADFHVENAVYREGDSRPQCEGVTIFHQGLVYDFLNDPSEVVIFDRTNHHFVLLDIARRVRTQISTEDVQGVVNRVKQRLSGHANPSAKWLADPVFDESYNPTASELILKSPMLTYRAQLQAAGPSMAAQYHEFSDWYTKFNLALTPSSRPPFPRMMLNDAIERYNGIAKEVQMTAAFNGSASPVKVSSRHHLATELNSSDMRHIAEAGEYLQRFTAVSLREYREGK